MIPGLESWGSGHIWAEYRSPIDGVLMSGMVTITLPVRLTNTADDAIIPPGVVLDKFVLNTMGENSFHIELPATDDPDIDQIGWGYDIMVVLEGFGTNPLTVETFSGVPVPLEGATNLRLLEPNETTIVGPPSLDLSKFARVNSRGELTDANGNIIRGTGDGGFTQTEIEDFARGVISDTISSGGSVHLGETPPPDLIVGAKVGDIYINTTNGNLYHLEEGE